MNSTRTGFTEAGGSFGRRWRPAHRLGRALVGYSAVGNERLNSEEHSSSGGIYAYPNNAIETADTQAVVYDFGNFLLEWDHVAALPADSTGEITVLLSSATMEHSW